MVALYLGDAAVSIQGHAPGLFEDGNTSIELMELYDPGSGARLLHDRVRCELEDVVGAGPQRRAGRLYVPLGVQFEVLLRARRPAGRWGSKKSLRNWMLNPLAARGGMCASVLF